MFSGRYNMEVDEDGCYFVGAARLVSVLCALSMLTTRTDRDPTHFRYVLNFLRDSHIEVPPLEGMLSASSRTGQVPLDDVSFLRELLAEAEFYQVAGLISLLGQALNELSADRTPFQFR